MTTAIAGNVKIDASGDILAAASHIYFKNSDHTLILKVRILAITPEFDHP